MNESYNGQQRRTNQIASLYGYKTAVMENSEPLEDFGEGDNVIILNDRGEPVMSGTIQEKGMSMDGKTQVRVNDEWFTEGLFSFRSM